MLKWIRIWRKCPQTGFIEEIWHLGNTRTIPKGWKIKLETQS